MPREFGRKQRVAELVRRELAVLLAKEINDPRMKGVTVTDVEVSPDLKHARVYVTSMPGRADKHLSERELLAVLKRAAGYLRRQLGTHVDLKQTPSLSFFYDHSIENGIRMDKLIDNAVLSDQKPRSGD